MASDVVHRYGITEQVASDTEIDQAAERLRLIEFAIVDGGYTESEHDAFAAAFDRAHRKMLETHGGRAALEDIGEHDIIRAPLVIEDAFLDLAQNPKIIAICKAIFGGQFILNQQNGIINPAKGTRCSQGSFHRDLPYQHFVCSRPLAINALYCVDPFTSENGATRVIPASHKEERFSSDTTILALEQSLEAKKGYFLLMDCMTYHSAGLNLTNRPRRAVNHLYSLPFIRQQLDLPSLLGKERKFPPATASLLNYGNQVLSSFEEYYAVRREKLLIRSQLNR